MVEASSSGVIKTIGIINENKSKWERRCALTPKEV